MSKCVLWYALHRSESGVRGDRAVLLGREAEVREPAEELRATLQQHVLRAQVPVHNLRAEPAKSPKVQRKRS